MQQIEIPLRPIDYARTQLAREVERLEVDGKRIRDIRYPQSAMNDLGIVPDQNILNAGTYRGHRASQYAQPYPGEVVIIIYEG